mgnify:CR=1 FL=1
MKKLFFILTMSMYITIGYANSTISLEESPLKKIEINMTVTATNGCNYTITGWVDVQANPFKDDFGGISAYNLNIKSPCGDLDVTAISGRVTPDNSSPDDVELSQNQLKSILLEIIDKELREN